LISGSDVPATESRADAAPPAGDEPRRGGLRLARALISWCRHPRPLAVAGMALLLVMAGLVVLDRVWPCPFSPDEIRTLRTMSLLSTEVRPLADPSNRFADHPRAAALGSRLFRDARLSGNGQVSCTTCHQPERAFTDGVPLARGTATGTRNTPSVVPAAASRWYFWDGRRDSQWSQALVPLEGAAEHGGTRGAIAQLIVRHYRVEFEAVFGPIPRADRIAALAGPAGPLGSPAARAAWEALEEADRAAIDGVFADAAKALAAYQRRLRFEPSPFDRYVEALARGNRLVASGILSEEQIGGLRLFIGRGQCTLCHRGPLLTSHEFFTLALPFGEPGPDQGRAGAFAAVRGDPFNCAGAHSDARPDDCRELRFMSSDQLGFLAAFKTPSLRNVSRTAPYMHAGQLATLDKVIAHYSDAPTPPFPEHTDILPRRFSARERAQLVAFLFTLDSPVNDPFAGGR
jgi:cytochrome c peroxidase